MVYYVCLIPVSVLLAILRFVLLIWLLVLYVCALMIWLFCELLLFTLVCWFVGFSCIVWLFALCFGLASVVCCCF